MQNELGLDQFHSDAMFALPAEKKWQIYCSRTKVGHLFYAENDILSHKISDVAEQAFQLMHLLLTYQYSS